jgi:hypothetical protein
MIRTMGGRLALGAAGVLLLAGCLGRGGGGSSTKALIAQTDDAFRVAPQLIDDLPEGPLQSRLQGLTVSADEMTSLPAAASVDITPSQAAAVEVTAVAESQTFTRLDGLMDDYGDDAWRETCAFVDVINDIETVSNPPSGDELQVAWAQRTGNIPNLPYQDVYNLIFDTGNGRGEALSKVVLWQACA